MRFTSALSALAVLAYTDAVFAAPTATDVAAETMHASTNNKQYAHNQHDDECEADEPADDGHSSGNPGSSHGGMPGGTPGGNAPADNHELIVALRLADTAADRIKLLKDDQFVFNFNQPQDKDKAGKGGQLIAANRKSFPALVGTGAGMAFGRVGPCGMNTLHVHPRSAELQIVTRGTLKTEMVPENGVLDDQGKRRVIRSTLKAGMMTPFYQGSVHVQYNPSCEEDAEFVAAFTSEDFGTGQIADETFALSDSVISATFGNEVIEGKDLDKVRKAIPKSIALGVEECLASCKGRKPGGGKPRPQ